MAENSKLTGIELNGVLYSLGKSIYEELDISLVRFVELLGRDFYCPTLSAAPTSSTLKYTDTDGEEQTFQIGQPCRWAEGSDYRIAICKTITASSASWHILPTKVSELTNDSGFLTQHQSISHLATKTELSNGLADKVDKVSGKQLSTEDFTTALKNKLNGLNNYDDATITAAVNKLRSDFDALVSGDTTTAIKTFNEVIAFLDGISDTQDLSGIIASIEQQISAKQDKINDLATIRSGAALGATALQSYTEKYTGTYSKPSSGIPKTDLATAVQNSLNKADTALQSHQDISGKLDKTEAASTYLSKTDASSTYLGKTAKAADATKADSATKATQDASGNVITSTYATKTEMGNKQDKNLYFTNKTASSWVSDSAYEDYPYRCDISCSGVTSDMYAEVVFSVEQSTSGMYAPVCETKSNVVSVWSNDNTSITIPTIIITK